jgi:SAM-dependent methyltransferase
LSAGDFPDETFDLVTLFHVFEHLSNPKDTMLLVRKVMKPDGRLVMSFPNIGSTQGMIFKGEWLHLDPPRHLFLFPRKAFINAMRELGFDVVAERHFSIEQNPYGFLQSVLNCILSERDVLYERLKGNKSYAKGQGAMSIALQKVAAAVLFPIGILLDCIDSLFNRGATVEYTLIKR